MATSRTAACISFILAASACRTSPCPDIAPPAAPAPPPVAPAPPSCPPISQADAQTRANEWLARKTGAPAAPEELTASACTSHCQRRGDSQVRTTACDTWSCRYKYGDRFFRTSVTIDVYVAACGANIFTVHPYARCFARPHRCEFAVRFESARAIAARELGEVGPEAVSLRWAADPGEFQWVVTSDKIGESWEDYEVLWISAHAADQLTRVDPPILHRPSW